jgi:UDP-glucose 4-epimerase
LKSILVTGGAGFIGSHTCLLLLEKGYEIFVIDSFINSSSKSLEKVLIILEKMNIFTRDRLHLIKGDLRIESDIEKVFQKSLEINKPIANVIHFAGLKSISDSKKVPLQYWDSNVVGTIKLLKIMDKYNCRNIVFSSSASVYKSYSKSLLNEDDICEPVNPYGYTKLTIEQILSEVYLSNPSKWRIACLRYFNPVGAHESGLIGEDPLVNRNNLYPKITKVAIGKLEKIEIFGSDWPTKDGTCIRDYIHVMDLAEGHLSALNHLIEDKPQLLRLNLGTGKGTSVLELVKIFEKVNNVIIPFSFVERRIGDNSIVVANNNMAKLILKWEPKRNIKDICRDGWNWQVKNPNGFNA